MRGCSGGYMFHLFSKETHQCKRCGRWQPGFAPKKSFVKARAECQICAREQACDKNGTLGHHGYQRPGWGSIYNDCFGEGYKPYPATDALEAWLKQLDGIEQRLEASKRNIAADKVESFTYEYRWGSVYGGNRQNARVEVRRGDGGYMHKEHHVHIPSYDDMKRWTLTQIDAQLATLPSERARVTKRIEQAHTLA